MNDQEEQYEWRPRLGKRHTGRLVILVVAVLVVIGVVVGVTQAGGGDKTTTPLAESSSGEEKAGPLTLKWGETATGSALEITIEAPVDDTANIDEMTREFIGQDKKTMYCLVTIKNKSAESYPYNPLAFAIYDSANMVCSSYEYTGCTQPEFTSGDLLPGRTVTGALAVLLPQDRNISYVDFQESAFSPVVASWGD